MMRTLRDKKTMQVILWLLIVALSSDFFFLGKRILVSSRKIVILIPSPNGEDQKIPTQISTRPTNPPMKIYLAVGKLSPPRNKPNI